MATFVSSLFFFLLQANRCALAVPFRSFFRFGVDQEVSV